MRTNPFYDAWLFLIGATGDHEGSRVRWLLVALFIALLIASAWIALRNWQQEPAQRSGAHFYRSLSVPLRESPHAFMIRRRLELAGR